MTVPVCHAIKFTLFSTRCLTASIITKCRRLRLSGG
jgi:hypothetical protein